MTKYHMYLKIGVHIYVIKGVGWRGSARSYIKFRLGCPRKREYKKKKKFWKKVLQTFGKEFVNQI